MKDHTGSSENQEGAGQGAHCDYSSTRCPALGAAAPTAHDPYVKQQGLQNAYHCHVSMTLVCVI